MMLLLMVATFLVSTSAQLFSPTGRHTSPRGCTNNCDYTAEWIYMEDGSDMIEFTISAKVPQGFWAGIAFSQDTNMINSDAVVGWVNSDTPVLSDRYLSSKALLGVAADDTPKNVNLESGSYKDGMLMFKFTRDRTTTDPKDESLDKCLYFLYAWGGIGLPGSLIGKHSKVDRSQSMVCVGRGARQITGGRQTAEGKEGQIPGPVEPSLFACSEPPNVPFTSNSGRGRQMFNVGETVEYTCDDGYETRDTLQKLCVGAGIWGGIDPKCTPIGSAIQVPDLPTIGSRVSCIGVQCPANSQCQITAGQSACICVTGFQPTRNGCAPQVIKTLPIPETASMFLSCRSPPTIPYTTNSGAGRQQFSVGAVVMYQCNLGYTPSGIMQKSCQPGGSWTSANPVCTRASGPEISTYPFSSSSICDTVTCQENSDCVDQGSYATCICRQGYDWAPNEKCVVTGTGVALPIGNVCAGNNCPANSQCIQENGVATCICMAGYDKDLNGYCITMTKPPIVSSVCTGIVCQANGICKEYSGIAVCECMDDYTPDVAQNCILDACKGFTCPINSECMMIGNAAICNCLPQYERNLAGQCVGMTKDRCKSWKCPLNSECVIINNVPECKCKAPYTENLLKLCVGNNVVASVCRGVSCPPSSNCVERDNKAFCDCIAGHQYNSKGECEAGNLCSGVKCKYNEYCVNGACKCKDNYVLQNGLCVDQKLAGTAVRKLTCVGFTCGRRGVCVVSDGKRRCECKAGYYKGTDGRCMETMKKDNVCDVACGGRRVCVNKNGKATCVCEKGYTEAANGLCIAISGCKNQCGTKRTKTGTGCSCHSSCARDYNCCSDYWTFCNGAAAYLNSGNGAAAYLNSGSRSIVTQSRTVVQPAAVLN